MPPSVVRERALGLPRPQHRGERPVDRESRLRRRSRELPPLRPQPFHALPQIATGLKASGIAIEQLVDPRQDHPAGSLGLNFQGVAWREASRTESPGRNRHLMLAGDPGLILYLLRHK